MALYKLRQTWGPYFQVSKLAAIDKHIHDGLDPNWPITATNTGTKEAAIFVNPKFLGVNVAFCLADKTHSYLPPGHQTHEKHTSDKAQIPTATPEVVRIPGHQPHDKHTSDNAQIPTTTPEVVRTPGHQPQEKHTSDNAQIPTATPEVVRMLFILLLLPESCDTVQLFRVNQAPPKTKCP